MLFCSFQNRFTWHHDSQIDDVVIIAPKNNANDIFSNIMDITFHRSEHHCSTCSPASLFSFHIWFKISDCLFHRPGRFHNLWQEHLSCSEQITYNPHPIHQRTFDDIQGSLKHSSCFLNILFNEIVEPMDEGMLQSLCAITFSPLDCLLFWFFLSFEWLCKLNQSLSCILLPIEDNILHSLYQILRYFFIHNDLSCIHYAHVHTCYDSMVEECRMHRFPNRMISSEWERQITHSSRDSCSRTCLLDHLGSLDEVDCKIIMFGDSRSNR